MDDWGTVVELKMDSDSLCDAGVMSLVSDMLVCVSSQSMQQMAEVVIEVCKRFAGRSKWFLLPDKRQTSSMRQVVKCFPRQSEGRRQQCSAVSPDVCSCRWYGGMDNNDSAAGRFSPCRL